MTASKQNSDQPWIGLRWLLRLRWFSVLGQIGVCWFAVQMMGVVLPLPILVFCIGFTALNNALLWMFGEKLRAHAVAVCLALIVLDTAVLTVTLYFSGGASNPFTALYLLHIALAAILLPAWGPWLIVGLCGTGFALLFFSPHHLLSESGMTCCSDMGTHSRGMLLSMVIAGAGIAYFVNRLSADLGRHRAELEEARAMSAKSEHFGALATLAAGLAHELATPLGTIAVVSADLEKQACDVCRDGSCQSDAGLIRSEVLRCRNILERLGHEALQGENGGGASIDLDSFAERLEPYLKATHFRRLRIENRARDRVLVMPETALMQCVAVLVKNACEAGDAGTPVVLTIESGDGEIRFTVSDTGSGMPEEVVSRLGEPFFTTKEPGFGMGLGLFLVRTFVERMRGRMEIDSVPGKGTTVRLVFRSEREIGRRREDAVAASR